MTILTDVDGVLLNWSSAFHRWMKEKHGFTPVDTSSYSLDKCYDLTEDQVMEYCQTFNASANMGYLPPIGDALYWVKKLHRTRGIVFHCITSMGSDYFARKLRVMNLETVFGKSVFEKITILGCGEDKTAALSEYKGSGMIWLEDHMGNANVGASLGLKSFLFEREYNRAPLKTENFIRIKNWKQLSGLIS